MNKPHVKPDFGLPYARAEFDGDGRYHVICPACGQKCYAPAGAAAEDAITKGASLAYADHFTQAANG